MKSVQTQLSIWAVAIVATAALLMMWLTGRGALASSLTPYRPVLIVLVVSILGVYSVAVRTIASPVRQLSDTMGCFGQGDLSARVEIDRSDEIGRVARRFNVMADRIQALVTAERRLLQDVSHEIRAPLARLRFAAELVKDSTDQEAAVERLTRDIDRLAALVGSLVQVARAEDDASSLRSESVRLDELIRQIVADCDPSYSQVHIGNTLETLVMGDPELLRRAVENVVTNAMRHGCGKAIHVSLTSRQGWAHVTVRDFGPGVPEAALTEIFRPFYRVDPARTRDDGGVGLGLAIAKRAIGLHRGRIWAENVDPGLRLTIELPMTGWPDKK